jgi:hypothetical protein
MNNRVEAESSGIKITPSFLNLHNGPFFESPHFLCKNTLIIGCGGLGTSVVNCLKKRMQEYVDTHDFNAVRFLTFDTAQMDRGTQKTYLEESEIMRPYSERLFHIINNVDQFPEIKEWFRDDPKMEAIKQEIDSSLDGAATTRPFGRISFFDKAEEVENVLKLLTQVSVKSDYKGIHGELISVDNKSFHVYVISSLSGGTGAGIYMDVAAMLRYIESRTKVGDTAFWHIFGVFILPEVICRDPRTSNHNRLWANAYASLKELDHFLSGHTFEVRHQHWDEKFILTNKDYSMKLFNMVFFADSTDRSEVKTRDDISEVIAEFLFYHTFTQGNPDYFNRYIDERAQLEFKKTFPEDADTDNQHLTLYSTFGVNSIYIPIKELVEYCNFRLALETFRFLCFSSSEDVEWKVKGLWEGKQSEGMPPLLKLMNLDEDKLSSVFSLRHNRKGGYNLQGSLQQFAVKRCSLINNIKENLGNQRVSWWQLWRRRIDIQNVSSEIDVKIQDLTSILKRFEDDPEYFPVSQGTGIQEMGSREMGKYKMDLDNLKKQILGEKELLENTFDEIMNKDGIDVSRELLFDLRENLEKYSDIPEIQDKPFQVSIPEDITNIVEINDYLNSIYDTCKNLVENRLIRAAAKKRAAFVNQAIKKLEQIEKGISEISENIKNMKMFFERQINSVRFKSEIWSRSAIDKFDADEIYREYFQPMLPNTLKPDKLAEDIRTRGLDIDIGGIRKRISLAEFDQYPARVVANALNNVVMEKLGLKLHENDPINQEEFLRDHKKIWCISFGDIKDDNNPHGVFTDTPSGGDDIDRLAGILKEGAEWHLSFKYPEGKKFRFCFSGSKAGNRDWSEIIKGYDIKKTVHYNQATLVRSIHGIPVSTLSSLAKWREAYELYQFEGWPLHLFRDAEDWQEPHTKQYRRDRLEGLLELAMKLDIVNKSHEKDGDKYNIKGIDTLGSNLHAAAEYMEEYKLASLFYSRTYHEIYIERREIMDLLEGHKDFKETLLLQMKKVDNLDKISDSTIKENLLKNPDLLTREELINGAIDTGLILKDATSDRLHFTLRTNKKEIDSMFFNVRYERSYPSKNDIVSLLRTNTVFYEYMLWEIIEEIMEKIKADDNYKEKIIDHLKQGVLPSDLSKELSDFLRG